MDDKASKHILYDRAAAKQRQHRRAVASSQHHVLLPYTSRQLSASRQSKHCGRCKEKVFVSFYFYKTKQIKVFYELIGLIFISLAPSQTHFLVENSTNSKSVCL